MRITPPRSSISLCACLKARCFFEPSSARSISFAPAVRPMKYEMWSPTNAPAAAARMIGTRLGSLPLAANTPALITRLSLGTIGKNASIAANAKSAR